MKHVTVGLIALLFAILAISPVSGQSISVLGGYTSPNNPDLLSNAYNGSVDVKVRGTHDIDATPFHLVAQSNYSRSGLDSDAIDGGAINRLGGMIGFGAHADINRVRLYTQFVSGIQGTQVGDFTVLGINAGGSDWQGLVAIEGAIGARIGLSSRFALQAETSYLRISDGQSPSWFNFLGGITVLF